MLSLPYFIEYWLFLHLFDNSILKNEGLVFLGV